MGEGPPKAPSAANRASKPCNSCDRMRGSSLSGRAASEAIAPRIGTTSRRESSQSCAGRRPELGAAGSRSKVSRSGESLRTASLRSSSPCPTPADASRVATNRARPSDRSSERRPDADADVAADVPAADVVADTDSGSFFGATKVADEALTAEPEARASNCRLNASQSRPASATAAPTRMRAAKARRRLPAAAKAAAPPASSKSALPATSASATPAQ
mmetsp:Transcript_98785/g.283804  ORF Transcript_98785/g.283804 Transcript_98785/m.283804 type:complete len:217 (+) Transcript_98785:233-883(+)